MYYTLYCGLFVLDEMVGDDWSLITTRPGTITWTFSLKNQTWLLFAEFYRSDFPAWGRRRLLTVVTRNVSPVSCHPHYQPYHHCRLSSKISTTRNQISIFGLKIWTSLKTNCTLHCKKPRRSKSNYLSDELIRRNKYLNFAATIRTCVCNLTVTKH